jgi:chromosome segregation ATPase
MSTAVINQLFEEGVTRSREMADAADETMRAIDDMAKHGEALAQRVDAEADEARQHIRELVGRLERSENELEASGHQAENALTTLADASSRLATEAASLLDRVKQSLAELETRREAVQTDLAARLTSTQGEVTELAAAADAARATAEDGLRRAGQAIADLRNAVDSARAGWGPKLEAWTSAADQLESEAIDHSEAWAEALSDLLERQSTALVEAANGMVDEHNRAMDHVTARFEQQAPLDLAEAIDPLEGELVELGQAAESREQELTGEGNRLAQWADAAVPVMDGLRAALDSVGGE